METRVIGQTMCNYFKLVGKTTTTTGARDGIGRGITKVLAGLGVGVVAYDIEKEDAEDAAGKIISQRLFTVAVHYSARKCEDIQSVVRTAADTCGTMDVLVNDTADCGGDVTIDDITKEG